MTQPTEVSNSELLASTIQNHLRDGGVVYVVTYLRCTRYTSKHAAWFTASKIPTDSGVYVQSGKRKLYVFPQSIKFGEVA